MKSHRMPIKRLQAADAYGRLALMSDRKLPQKGPAGGLAGLNLGAAPAGTEVHFDRREFDQILQVYGRMVALGAWRDYGLSFDKDAAVFAIYRRATEMPLYRIEKRPKLRQRQGAYAVLNAAGLVLKRGQDLAQVLKVLETRRLSLVD
jgi:hypothetical protein